MQLLAAHAMVLNAGVVDRSRDFIMHVAMIGTFILRFRVATTCFGAVVILLRSSADAAAVENGM